MSPQDKAKQLVEKYLNLSVNVIHTDCEGDISIAAGTPTQSHAKQCALIAVDEMIKTAEIFDYCETIVKNYNEVKTEIEKL